MTLLRFHSRSLHYDLKESDIIALFSAFGKIEKCDMSNDGTGRSKGFCFLEFQDPASAQAALTMDGFEIAGRRIKVGKPTSGSGSAALTNSLQNPINSLLNLAVASQVK